MKWRPDSKGVNHKGGVGFLSHKSQGSGTWPGCIQIRLLPMISLLVGSLHPSNIHFPMRIGTDSICLTSLIMLARQHYDSISHPVTLCSNWSKPVLSLFYWCQQLTIWMAMSIHFVSNLFCSNLNTSYFVAFYWFCHHFDITHIFVPKTQFWVGQHYKVNMSVNCDKLVLSYGLRCCYKDVDQA